MSEKDSRHTLERYRQEFFERQNTDAIDDLMHDDYVEEYPQSGEKIRTKTRGPSMRTIRAYRA